MPLRNHFLNVGHGDCTIIEHPSGRLTMIDVNNSQDYDSESLTELMKERGATQQLSLSRNPFAIGSLGGALGPSITPPTTGLLGEYMAAFDAARGEITDP